MKKAPHSTSLAMFLLGMMCNSVNPLSHKTKHFACAVERTKKKNNTVLFDKWGPKLIGQGRSPFLN